MGGRVENSFKAVNPGHDVAPVLPLILCQPGGDGLHRASVSPSGQHRASIRPWASL